MPWKRNKQYRLPGYDYSQNGAYFITIVTKGREHHFGNIVNAQMAFSPIGDFVADNIIRLDSSKENVSVSEWTIMPNHIHLIILLTGRNDNVHDYPIGLQPLARESISAVINHFKGRIKRWCNEHEFPDFEWQARFHDRIIRDDDEYYAIANYIRNNVENWDKDNEHL